MCCPRGLCRPGRWCSLLVVSQGSTAVVAKHFQRLAAATNPDWEIGSSEYSELAVTSLRAWAGLDFDAWAATMSDDVEYHFPDGDAGTRTSLIGKAAVLDWWTEWKTTSGIESLSYFNNVDIPVVAKVANPSHGLSGPLVISYFSQEIVFTSGATVKLRLNFVMYFDDAKQITRFFTYYDRSGIIEAMGTNVLQN